jgi:hypothetical protein
MGKLTDKLRKEWQIAAGQKIVSMEALRRGGQHAEELKTVEELIEDGYYPLHAIYLAMANFVSVFVEEAVDFPFFHQVEKFLLKAQDRYNPGYPPLSPITMSHYNFWSFFDVPFGRDNETVGECFLGLSDLFGIETVFVEAVEKLCGSRLGLYKIVNASSGTFQIRELVTGREMETIIPTGFHAKAGCLAFLRVLPPLTGVPSSHVAVTTPYVTLGTSEDDWLRYFERQQILAGAPGSEVRLNRHMKRGNDVWYWCEYFFYGYVNHRSDAIFVAGLPDHPDTQPQHSTFNKKSIPGKRQTPS